MTFSTVATKEPNLEAKRLHARTMLDRLERQGNDVSEALACLDVTETNLRRLWRSYKAYDFVWQGLHTIRHQLCLLTIESTDLLDIVRDVSADLNCIADGERAQELRKEVESIKAVLKGRPPGVVNEPALRARLREVSEDAGAAREAYWRRVNRQRNRLRATAALLAVVLLATSVGIALYVPMRFWLVYSVIGLGAAGGLFSSLSTLESQETSPAEFEIQQLLLYLKPIVGATAALVLYLVNAAHVIEFFPGQASNGGLAAAIPLVLAFAAGFSERLFVAKLEDLTGKDAPSKAKTAQSRNGKR